MLMAFPLQKWLHEHALMLRCMFIVYVVIRIKNSQSMLRSEIISNYWKKNT